VGDLDDDVVAPNILGGDCAGTEAQTYSVVKGVEGFSDETSLLLEGEFVAHRDLLEVDWKHEARLEDHFHVCEVAPSPWQERRIDAPHHDLWASVRGDDFRDDADGIKGDLDFAQEGGLQLLDKVLELVHGGSRCVELAIHLLDDG